MAGHRCRRSCRVIVLDGNWMKHKLKGEEGRRLKRSGKSGKRRPLRWSVRVFFDFTSFASSQLHAIPPSLSSFMAYHIFDFVVWRGDVLEE